MANLNLVFIIILNSLEIHLKLGFLYIFYVGIVILINEIVTLSIRLYSSVEARSNVAEHALYT